jgi:hypothetical protein
MKAKHVETLWLSYRAILPKTASASQIIETRRAFYAGCQGLFHYILSNFEKGEEATDADMAMMDDITRELSEFAKLVGNGVA